MKRFLLLLMIIISYDIIAQVSDDFEDGNLTQNPQWNGDLQLFIINVSNQLQLTDTDEGDAYLSTENLAVNNIEWRCWIKLAFSPSANNYARYYLMSNNQNLQESLDGYLLQLGESGSNDAIELFRQEGTDLVSVCRGSDGLLSSSFEIRVKITRDEIGLWRIYVDPSGGEDFIFEAEGIDNKFSQTSFIGFVCNYTKSNSAKMYFDDVYAGPIIVDTVLPILESVVAENDSTLYLQFDEVVSQESVSLLSNYVVDHNIGIPKSAIRNEFNASMVVLIFSNKFGLGINYTVDVNGIEDLSENTMAPTQIEFNYYVPQPYEIVINEIMADPTPPVGLPEFEYIELYNQTQSAINLEGWKLLVGTSEKTFSSVSIQPESYLIIAKETSNDEFASYGDFYGIVSLSLTNSGQSIELHSDEGVIISSVNFTEDWYQSQEKEEGGWSLELKNPDNICSGKGNWQASNDPAGGSPGKMNSVANDQILLPEIEYLEIVYDNLIMLSFNQVMNEETINQTNNYSVSGDFGNPQYVYTYDDEPQKAELHFENSFNYGFVYNLAISQSIENCMHLGMIRDTVLVFGLHEVASLHDVIINEILFNPWTGGEDYVELYNRSSKTINLSELYIGSIKESSPNPPDTSIYSIINRQKLLLPSEYIVISKSPDAVKNQYNTSNPSGFLKVDPFPSLNNDNGHVFLLSKVNTLIDSFSYSENLHFQLLAYHDGVSLERINPDVNISDKSNWHSAAESVGFGTPGMVNSQYVSQSAEGNEITIDPEIFSPDNDGFDDILNIKYKFQNSGYVISVKIYNSEGYQVRELANNQYIGTEGSISWDGMQDNNSKAPVGIYVFYITIYDLGGNVKKYKKTGVLATRL